MTKNIQDFGERRRRRTVKCQVRVVDCLVYIIIYITASRISHRACQQSVSQIVVEHSSNVLHVVCETSCVQKTLI